MRYPVARLPLYVMLASLALAPVAGVVDPSIARADQSATETSYVGSFANPTLTMELSEAKGEYVGQIIKGSSKFPVKASRTARGLAGTFTANGREYPFTATLANDQLTLLSLGKTYALSRSVDNPLDPAPAPNPLDAAPTPAPAAAPAGGAGGAGKPTPGDITVLGSTKAGEALFITLAPGATFDAAIAQSADRLAKALDGRPTLTKAFADGKTRTKGGAAFTGKRKGEAVRGLILVDASAASSSADVVFAAANASRAETAALLDFIPRPIKLVAHAFPDGSGSVSIPADWTTPTVSASSPIIAVGPAGQTVIFNGVIFIYDPQCRTVRQSRQLYQMRLQTYQRQMQAYQNSVRFHQQHPNTLGPGAPPTRPPAPDADPNDAAIEQGSPLRYCKYCDGPGDVVKRWYPELEAIGKRHNKPYTSVDKIFAVVDAPVDSALGQAKAGVAYLAVTDHSGDKAVHYRTVNQIVTSNTTPGEVWQLNVTVVRAPDATFDADLPVMNAILDSVKLDAGVVGKEIDARGEAIRKASQAAYDQMEKNHQQFQDEQASRFADFQREMAAQAKARHDSSSDMIEFASGLRSIYNTQTGQFTQVNLYDADGIAAALNYAYNDPNLYISVPLRYLRPQ